MVLNLDKYKLKYCWKSSRPTWEPQELKNAPQIQTKILLKDQATWELQKMVLNLDKRSAMPNDLFSTAWHFSDGNLVAEQLVQFILITTSTIVIRLNSDHSIGLPYLALTQSNSDSFCWAVTDKTLPCEDVNSVQLVEAADSFRRLSKLSSACNSCRSRRHLIQEVD